MTEKKNIPQGYKDSPLGIIPKEWEVKRLGDIADITSGTTPLRANREYYNNGVIPWVKTTDLNNGTLYETEEKVSKEAVEKTSLKILPKGTVLVAMYGGFRQIGRTALLGIDATINQALSALMCKSSVESPFVLAWLNCRVNYWKRLAASSRKDPNITGNEVAKFPILIPSKEEQGCIVEVLGLWDTAIEKQSELVEKLKLRKQALMQQLLTGKKRLPEFSGEWKKRTYSSILTEVKRSLKWDENELYKLISVRRRSEGLFFRESLYGRDIATKNLRPAKTGDFLISKMQIVHGASGLVTDEFDDAKISGSYISLVSKDSNILDIRYYNFWSQMPIFYHQTFVSSFGVHIEKMTFDLDTFMSFGMPLPPIEEQHAIVSLIESVNKEIKLANEKLTNYQSQKRGLMQQLLTGKKRTINIE